MFSLPEPSPRTRSLWGRHQRHAIRIESSIVASNISFLIFALVQIAIMRTEAKWIAVLYLPVPLLSLCLSSAAIFAFTWRSLHPIYSVSIASVLFPLWMGTLYWVISFNTLYIELYDDVGDPQDGYEGYFPYPIAPIGVLVIVDILYAAVTALHLVYIGFAAKAVDDYRKGKRGPKQDGNLEFRDELGIELAKNGKNAVPPVVATKAVNNDYYRKGKWEEDGDEMEFELVKHAGPA